MLEMLALRKHFLRRKSDFVYCTYLNLVGVCFYTFLRSVPLFHRCCIFYLTGQGLLECGSPPHLVHMLLLFLAVIFSFGFRKVFLKLNPTSSFKLKTFYLMKNCKLSVIPVTGIAGFALIPSCSLCFASGSLKPEINFMFTNSSSGLAAVFSFSKSQ